MPIEEHERREKLFRGYTAFIVALLVAVIVTSNDYPHAQIVIALFSVSVPSLVALMLLDFIVIVRQGRRKSFFRGVAVLLGFVPSLLSMTILIGHVSVIAAILFAVSTLFWCLAIDVVVFLGSKRSDSEFEC